jgi:hypothetical protein
VAAAGLHQGFHHHDRGTQVGLWITRRVEVQVDQLVATAAESVGDQLRAGLEGGDSAFQQGVFAGFAGRVGDREVHAAHLHVATQQLTGKF